MDWLKYENEAIKNGYKVICGIDEAGRGPLAGPVFSAAVILDESTVIDGVNDSKKLSEKKREKLYYDIISKAKDYSIAFASEEEIDNMNILNATFLSMKRAVDGLKIKPDFALVDGNRLPGLDIDSQAIVKGDSLSMSIACASILAKVTRDKLMIELSKQYPEYQFEKHKGYGTALHVQMLKSYGPCKIHRKSFLKKILGECL